MATPEAIQLPPDSTAARTYTWSELRTNTHCFEPDSVFLSEGDVITGFNSLVEVDGFTDMIMQVMSPYRSQYKQFDPTKAGLDHNGHKTYQGWRDGTKRIEEAVRPKNYFGKIVDLRTLMLDDIIATKPQANWRDKFIPIETRYALFGNLHPTGCGVQGLIAELVKVRFSKGNGNSTLYTASYKKLPANNAEQTADKLRSESIEMANGLIMAGLRNVFSAGIPTLGRRK